MIASNIHKKPNFLIIKSTQHSSECLDGRKENASRPKHIQTPVYCLFSSHHMFVQCIYPRSMLCEYLTGNQLIHPTIHSNVESHPFMYSILDAKAQIEYLISIQFFHPYPIYVHPPWTNERRNQLKAYIELINRKWKIELEQKLRVIIIIYPSIASLISTIFSVYFFSTK